MSRVVWVVEYESHYGKRWRVEEFFFTRKDAEAHMRDMHARPFPNLHRVVAYVPRKKPKARKR